LNLSKINALFFKLLLIIKQDLKINNSYIQFIKLLQINKIALA